MRGFRDWCAVLLGTTKRDKRNARHEEVESRLGVQVVTPHIEADTRNDHGQ